MAQATGTGAALAQRELKGACHQPRPRATRPGDGRAEAGAAESRGGCRRPPHTHHALLTCFEAGKRGNAPKPTPRSERRAPRPAQRSRGAAPSRPGPPHRPPMSADPPRPRRRSGAPALTLAVTCCRRRLPPHTTPDSGDGGGGWFRGSHMRPPGPRASGSRRRGPPRSARIRDAGPAAGTNADPPLRLWLPRETPSFSVPRCPRPAPGTTCRGERLLSELPAPRRSAAPRHRHRLQNGARGSRPRAFPGASPPGGGACPQRRARVGRAHAGALTAPRSWGPSASTATSR